MIFYYFFCCRDDDNGEEEMRERQQRRPLLLRRRCHLCIIATGFILLFGITSYHILVSEPSGTPSASFSEHLRRVREDGEGRVTIPIGNHSVLAAVPIPSPGNHLDITTIKGSQPHEKGHGLTSRTFEGVMNGTSVESMTGVPTSKGMTRVPSNHDNKLALAKKSNIKVQSASQALLNPPQENVSASPSNPLAMVLQPPLPILFEKHHGQYSSTAESKNGHTITRLSGRRNIPQMEIRASVRALLKAFDGMVQSTGEVYFLFAGTMLSQWCHGGIFLHDTDADVGMLQSAFQRMLLVLKQNASLIPAGMQLVVRKVCWSHCAVFCRSASF